MDQPMPEKNAARFLAVTLLMTIATSAAALQQSPWHVAPKRLSPAQQTAQAQQPAQGETPQHTTATYNDWIVQCDSQAGSPPQKLCEMGQVTQVQGKNLPFSRVAVARPVKGQPVKIIVQVPVNVSFATDVRIQTGDADPGIAAPFARCAPAGCFAEFDIKDDVVKKLRAASGAGKLSFADSAAHNVAVPLSFNGFNQAYDALSKE
jgi:invasion protein IalB